MSDRKHIFDWNHISTELTKDQIEELKSYYETYHRKPVGLINKLQNVFKVEMTGDSLSIIFATGGIVSAVATSGVSLVAISTTSLLIQIWMKHKNLDLKIQNCTYAYQSYRHLLNTIKDTMRGGNFQANSLHIIMNNIDNYVTDNTPVVDKFLQKYDKFFCLLNDSFHIVTS